MKKTAIVIGATGLVGGHVVNHLSQADHIGRVITITRREVQHPSAKVSNLVIDFDDLSKHADLFNGDLLFLCLGTTLKQAGSIEAQRVVDLDYQLQAAKMAVEQGVEHLLLVSSSGANDKSRNAYMKMKGELETAVRALGFKRVSIFQPSLLLGERPATRLAESIGALVMPALCLIPGLRRYRPIQGEQVAQKMVDVSASASQDSDGKSIQIFNLDKVFP